MDSLSVKSASSMIVPLAAAAVVSIESSMGFRVKTKEYKRMSSTIVQTKNMSEYLMFCTSINEDQFEILATCINCDCRSF